VTLLYFDCFSGAAGDMIVGALIDAGVPLADVRHALGSLAVSPEAVWTDRVVRAGISATKFCVQGEETAQEDAAHSEPAREAHAHSHGGTAVATHQHRSLPEIFRLIDGSALSGAGKDRAKALFEKLGEVEAAIHGTSLDAVHLHEVGALDSIVDIVGTVYALEALGVQQVVSSPLNLGGGTVRSSHGVYPIPAPATLQLLQGAPVYAGRQKSELVTPTGALIVTAYASSFGPVPAMTVKRIGYGAGSRDFVDAPNVLRVLIGEADATAPSHQVVTIEAEIDDMNPQIFGLLMDRLLQDGALDVFYTPIQMKKNRPGTLLTVIAAPQARERLTSIVFRETTTIGVRYREMTRECLDREIVTVTTTLGPVRMKVARRDGVIFNAAPEFEDCVKLATEHGRPLKDVQALASRAFIDRG
jgi:pyridinium-3,5-bisthiocarboxylic acid mononucleotide nickel chelatase